MDHISRDRFEELVDAALADIPRELTELLDNVAMFIEDEPPADQPGLLGYYEGVALTERDSSNSGVLPDRIVIFRLPMLSGRSTEDDVLREERITADHEIANHLGSEYNRWQDTRHM